MDRAQQMRALSDKLGPIGCNGCTACCWHDSVPLTGDDDLIDYRWHMEGGMPVLDRRDDGACVYLADAGCSIHDEAPGICKRMDCRVLYQITSPERRAQREQENPQMIRIYAAARARMPGATS